MSLAFPFLALLGTIYRNITLAPPPLWLAPPPLGNPGFATTRPFVGNVSVTLSKKVGSPLHNVLGQALVRRSRPTHFTGRGTEWSVRHPLEGFLLYYFRKMLQLLTAGHNSWIQLHCHLYSPITQETIVDTVMEGEYSTALLHYYRK